MNKKILYIVFCYIKTGDEYPDLYSIYSTKKLAKKRCRDEYKKDSRNKDRLGKYWYFVRPIELNSDDYFDIGDI